MWRLRRRGGGLRVHACVCVLWQEVYARNLEGQLRSHQLFAQAPPFNNNRRLAARAEQRLRNWRAEWAQGLVRIRPRRH